MEEHELADLLKRGFSNVIHEGAAFADKLLERCLSELEGKGSHLRSKELEDSDLDMLAAAGDPSAQAGGHRRIDP